MADFKTRIIRAAKLDPSLYEEVKADKRAIGQAMMVVVLSGVAGGIGHIAKGGLSGIFIHIILAFISWYALAFFTYFIGAKLFPETSTKADLGKTLRTIGFSASPGLIQVLGVIPVLANLVFLVAFIWMLIAIVVAVRQTFNYKSIIRAVTVCIISIALQLVIILPLALMLSKFFGSDYFTIQ